MHRDMKRRRESLGRDEKRKKVARFLNDGHLPIKDLCDIILDYSAEFEGRQTSKIKPPWSINAFVELHDDKYAFGSPFNMLAYGALMTHIYALWKVTAQVCLLSLCDPMVRSCRALLTPRCAYGKTKYACTRLWATRDGFWLWLYCKMVNWRQALRTLQCVYGKTTSAYTLSRATPISSVHWLCFITAHWHRALMTKQYVCGMWRVAHACAYSSAILAGSMRSLR